MNDSYVKIKLDRKEILKIPPVTGIYIFSRKCKMLYIGKDINIKARLLSHLENAKIDHKEALIIEGSDSIEYLVTDSEFKALLLESKLIQIHKPRYNVRWRDDKSYLYIKIPILDDFPKIQMARREREKGVLYFGPFPSTKSVEGLLGSIRRIFPFCTQKSVSKYRCFHAKIGLCGPCPSEISQLKDDLLKRRLKREYRHNIRQVIKILEGKTKVVQQSLYKEIKTAIASQDYENALEIRNKIYRFEKLILQRLFDETDPTAYNQSEEAVKDLLHILIPFLPNLQNLNRVECYDISNLSFKEATASLVVMADGQIKKDQYRKFKIKNPKLESDFEMIDEVIKRRFKNKWPEPNLIVIDGGKPQVRVVMSALATFEKKIPIIGIAKNPDRLILGIDGLATIRPSLNNRGFNLIRHLRDESHRFARKYHLHLRNKKLLPKN